MCGCSCCSAVPLTASASLASIRNLVHQLLQHEATDSQHQQDLADLQQQLNVALQEQVAGRGAQLQAMEAKSQQLLRL